VGDAPGIGGDGNTAATDALHLIGRAA